MRCMVSRRISHFSVAESLGCGAPNSLSKASANCDMRFGCDIWLTSIRGFPCFCVQWNLFGCSLILQHTKEWSVLQSALWYERVCRTFLREARLSMIRSNWCQCFERGCLQETMCTGHGKCTTRAVAVHSRSFYPRRTVQCRRATCRDLHPLWH